VGGCATVIARRTVEEKMDPVCRNEVRSKALTGMMWIEAIIDVAAFAGFLGIAHLGMEMDTKPED
jgi:hypothetical protein